jgi:hypothetical protein
MWRAKWNGVFDRQSPCFTPALNWIGSLSLFPTLTLTLIWSIVICTSSNRNVHSHSHHHFVHFASLNTVKGLFKINKLHMYMYVMLTTLSNICQGWKSNLLYFCTNVIHIAIHRINSNIYILIETLHIHWQKILLLLSGIHKHKTFNVTFIIKRNLEKYSNKLSNYTT